MLPSHLTQKMISRGLSTISHVLVKSLASPSVKEEGNLGQDVSEVPNVSIGDHTLHVVDEFTYLGSTVSSNLSLDPELNKRIGKAATTMAKLSKREWENNKLISATKIAVNRSCVLKTLLYGSGQRELDSLQTPRTPP